MTSSPYARLNALAAQSSNWRALFGWRRVRTVAILCALFIARKLPTVHHS